MNNKVARQQTTTGNDSITGLDQALHSDDLTTLMHDGNATGAADRSIDSTPTVQAGIGSIDDGVNCQRGNISLQEYNLGFQFPVICRVNVQSVNTIEEIKSEERVARLLEPGIGQRNTWSEAVMTYANAFLEAIPDGKAFQQEDTSKQLEGLPFSENGREMDGLLELLSRTVDHSGINPASHGHVGYIPGGGIFPSALGDLMADVTNRYAGVYFANPGAVRMENMLIRWMCDLIGYPAAAHGNLASGGSVANLMGITAARDAMGIRSRDVEQCVIYVNPQTHHCIHKAIRIAGLADAHLRQVPLDERYKMSAVELQKLIDTDKQQGLRPFLIVASLGSTDTGAVDPIEQIAQIAQDENIWLQVDAAYGGFFVLVEELKQHFRGISQADSYVVDPHKGMFLPYGTGALLVKDASKLSASHFYQANYMQDAVNASGQFSPADLSPELTKHFRGLRMWLPMQLFGTKPFVAALREKWLLARYFHTEIAKRGYIVGPDPELSVAIYRYDEPGLDASAFNAAIADYVRKDGRMFISSTLIDGVFWLRLAVLCFRTHLEHIDLLLELLSDARENLLQSGSYRL